MIDNPSRFNFATDHPRTTRHKNFREDEEWAKTNRMRIPHGDPRTRHTYFRLMPGMSPDADILRRWQHGERHVKSRYICGRTHSTRCPSTASRGQFLLGAVALPPKHFLDSRIPLYWLDVRRVALTCQQSATPKPMKYVTLLTRIQLPKCWLRGFNSRTGVLMPPSSIQRVARERSARLSHVGRRQKGAQRRRATMCPREALSPRAANATVHDDARQLPTPRWRATRLPTSRWRATRLPGRSTGNL